VFKKNEVRAIFSRVTNALTGVTFLSSPAKQLIQTKATFKLGDKEYKLDWNVQTSDNGISHRKLLLWLTSDSDVANTGNVMLGYLLATLSNDISRRCVLTIAIVEEILAETGMTFSELVEKLGLSVTDGCLTQTYYDSLKTATLETLQVQDYTCLRDVFAKTKNSESIADVKIEL
jgi:hypothetical protein